MEIDTQFFLEWGIKIAYAFAILLIGRVLAGGAHRLTIKAVRKRNLDELIGRFLANLARYTVLIFAVVAALEKIGIETTSIVAIVASAGLAVGLALQGNLANFSSGVLLLIFRPFELNEVIDAGGATGRVDEIGLFTTTLVTPDNKKIIVPNSGVTGGNITNLTTLGTRGNSVPIGVAYGEDLDHCEKVLIEACKTAPMVLAEPPPVAIVTDFGASSVNFLVKYTATSADAVGSRHGVAKALYKGLNDAGIEIPFDQVVMHQAPTADADAAAG